MVETKGERVETKRWFSSPFFLRGAHMIDMNNIKLKIVYHAIILKKVFGQTMFNKY